MGKNNINIYGYKNIEVINDCALNFTTYRLIEINPNVIFIDPPWGGVSYKNNNNFSWYHFDNTIYLSYLLLHHNFTIINITPLLNYNWSLECYNTNNINNLQLLINGFVPKPEFINRGSESDIYKIFIYEYDI